MRHSGTSVLRAIARLTSEISDNLIVNGLELYQENIKVNVERTADPHCPLTVEVSYFAYPLVENPEAAKLNAGRPPVKEVELGGHKVKLVMHGQPWEAP